MPTSLAVFAQASITIDIGYWWENPTIMAPTSHYPKIYPKNMLHM